MLIVLLQKAGRAAVQDQRVDQYELMYIFLLFSLVLLDNVAYKMHDYGYPQ